MEMNTNVTEMNVFIEQPHSRSKKIQVKQMFDLDLKKQTPSGLT